MDYSSTDFMELSVNDVSDLLLNTILDNGKDSSCVDRDGNQFELSVQLKKRVG